MTEHRNFSFSDDSVASAYDSVLVPVLFAPWAVRLVQEYGPWVGLRVLDLATGTGILAELLAEQVGPEGKVIGIDINIEMLSKAKNRCAHLDQTTEFIESPAHPLEVSDNAVDVVVCQQGFQFFPDGRAAAAEMHRVLQVGGRVLTSTWRPVAECDFFKVICQVLGAIEESEIADMMRVPFDFMTESVLASHFSLAGFVDIEVKQQEQNLVFSGGVKHAISAAYATPIAPKLYALPEEKQALFQKMMAESLNELSDGGLTMGRMVSNVLTAQKST